MKHKKNKQLFAMEIKVEQHRTPLHEGSREAWQYFVTVIHGNNWEWALLTEEQYNNRFDSIENTMKNRVLSTPQTHQFKKRLPWFDGHFVRYDGYPERAEGKVIYFSTSSI